MTGTHQREKPESALRTLLDGFDSMTLDPAPRLRRVREEMSRPPGEAIERAWKSAGKAMLKALRDLAGELRDASDR